MSTSELITPDHLSRQALIYVRQSSPNQTLTNQESLRLQYALRQHATEFGWPPETIAVIDADLGQTGSTAEGRRGFADLVTRVTLGQVGIIFSYDVTRLSRNCSDWYQLLDLCGFLAVDPENRLVARTLEKDWNEKLAAAEQVEREQAATAGTLAPPLSPEERRRILNLAEDLPALWHAPTTTQVERKQLLRLLIKDVTLTKGATTNTAAMRWQTEVCSAVEVPRPPRSCEARRTPTAVVERVRALAANHTDHRIAERMNADGWRSGAGGHFTASKIQWIRYVHEIPNGCPEGPAACEPGKRGDGRCSARVAAEALNVTVYTVADWCKSGRLDGIQAVAHGPWWVQLTPAVINQLRKPIRRQWKKRSSK